MTETATESKATGDAALCCQDLGFAYHRGQPVLESITAGVRPGAITALLGPNAAGKTTLLKLMLGQLAPTAGRILLDDTPVRKLTGPNRAAAISYVPQQASTHFSYTVEQVITMARYQLPEHPTAVADAIAANELDDLRARPFVELSAGQQQRVLLGRAMAQAAGDGKLMLLDEPTASMDLAWAMATMKQLRRLADDGLAVFVVLHDLNLAARFADRVWLLDDGKLAAEGDWWHVLLPEVLEPVYRLPLQIVQADDQDRPVLLPQD